MIPLGKPKIDSLRIHLPLSQVQVNPAHSSFMRSITKSNDDGEVLDEHVETTYFNPDAIVSCRYAVKRPFGVETIFIGFSAKSLMKNYFIGIDKHTIKQCFQFINNEGLITITKEAFLNASVVDVDFCIDYYLDTEDHKIKDVVQICSNLTIPRKDVTISKWLKKTNCGIEWNKREEVLKSYHAKQYLKYYAKADELKNNERSIRLYNEDLKLEKYQDLNDIEGNRHPNNKFFVDDRLLRVETTIKNNQHFKTYGYKVKTLNDLMKLELDREFLQVFNRPMSKYMTGYREINHTEGMTMAQKFKYCAMKLHAEINKMNIENSIPYYVNMMHPDVSKHSARSNLKADLFSIINRNEVAVKTIKHNRKMWREFIGEIEAKNLIPKKPIDIQ